MLNAVLFSLEWSLHTLKSVKSESSSMLILLVTYWEYWVIIDWVYPTCVVLFGKAYYLMKYTW